MQQLLQALTQNPDKRTQEVLDTMTDVLQKVKFFDELFRTEEIKQNIRFTLQEFSKYLQLETFSNGEHICNEGDKGDKFYLILEGEVHVYRKITDFDDCSFYQNNTKIGTLKEGDTFGELALSLNKPRFATIISYNDVKVCTINKDSYLKMNQYIQRELQLKCNALISVFPKLSQNNIIRIACKLQILAFPRNHCIFKQQQQPTGFYIISDGEVRLEKFLRTKISQNYFPQALLTSGSVIGFENALNKQPYQNQAICLNKVTVYKFTNEQFDQINDEIYTKCLKTSYDYNYKKETFNQQSTLKQYEQKINIRDLIDEEKKPKYNHTRIASAQIHRQMKKIVPNYAQNLITFRNPFFGELDPYHFKQIKKISLESNKSENLKKYNSQFSVQNFFEPINIGELIEPLKTARNEKAFSFATSPSIYKFPASGFNRITSMSSQHSRTTSQSTKRKQV